MSWTRKQTAAVVALALLVASVPVLWQIASVREQQARAAKQAELATDTVDGRQSPGDYDGDGIDDGADRCPTRPETENGFQDGDGCPDVVETTGAS
jgi:hypothetical protein